MKKKKIVYDFRMFNSIVGCITAKLPQTLHIETGGIEWDLTVPDSTLAKLPPVGEQARVYVWLYHREDAMKFFAFSSLRERSLFLDLMKVEGIGPKAAIKILSGISADQLENALETENLAVLETISGIGKKTAQKMLLTLRGKLSFEETPSPSKPQSKWADVITALVNMGYDKKMAETTLERLETTLDPAKTRAEQEEQLFRSAIVELAN